MKNHNYFGNITKHNKNYTFLNQKLPGSGVQKNFKLTKPQTKPRPNPESQARP